MDFEVWNYPNVDTLISIDVFEDNDERLDETQENTADDPTQNSPLYAETQKLLGQIELAESISQALSNQLKQVNETFLNQTALLIKKITQSVILKEIALDTDRLKHMIDKTLNDIQQENDPCTIYVCPEQHDDLQSHTVNYPDLTIKPDPSLPVGDFKIKTAFNIVESVLENRLNELFGTVNSNTNPTSEPSTETILTRAHQPGLG